MSEDKSASESSETPTPSAAHEAAEGAANEPTPNNGAADETIEKIGNFPPEIATLLIVAGVAGVLLPGPVGAPLLIAGGVVLWPKTFRPIENWFCRKFPAVHREGVTQLKEFLSDLNRRFPEQE